MNEKEGINILPVAYSAGQPGSFQRARRPVQASGMGDAAVYQHL